MNKKRRNTPLQVSDELERDLELLESLRWFDKVLIDRLCEASATKEEEILSTLRIEATRQLSEFFYVLNARVIHTEAQIAVLAEIHNDYIVALSKDAAKMQRLGLRADRLLQAMFTADTLPRLLQNWRDKPGSIDQSNLARFLVTVMSTETCRKVVVACEKAGFIAREKTAYGTVLISSTGSLEKIFGQSLREFRQNVVTRGTRP